MEITDLNEAAVVSYRYDPYGKVTITVGGTPQTGDPLGQHWTFTGRFLDEESGLYYYRARHYDPSRGRFLQRDLLGYEAGPNLFSYVDQGPSNGRDPTGQQDDERPPVTVVIRTPQPAPETDDYVPPFPEPPPLEEEAPIDDTEWIGPDPLEDMPPLIPEESTDQMLAAASSLPGPARAYPVNLRRPRYGPWSLSWSFNPPPPDKR